MLKFIYRSIIITILSVCLITEAVADPATTTTNSDGSTTTTQEVHFKGFKDEQDIKANITMLIVSLFSLKLYAYTPEPMDMVIANAAGVAYLLGPLAEIASSKDVNEQTLTIVKNSVGTPDAQQLAALQKLKDSLQKALDGVQLKRNLQQVAEYAYLAAATWATGIWLYSLTLDTTQITATTTTGSTACVEVLGGEAICASCLAAEPLLALKTAIKSATLPAMSEAAYWTFQANVTSLKLPEGGCVGAAATAAANNANDVLNMTHAQTWAVIALFTALFAAGSSAKGSMGQLIFGGIGLTTLMPFFSVLTAFLDTWMVKPALRALGYVVFAGLAKLSVDASDDVIKDLKQQIGDLDAIITALNPQAGGPAPTAGPATVPAPATNPGPNYTPPLAQSANPTLGTCALSSGNSNCPTLSSKINNASLNPNFPADITSAGAGLASGFDNLLGGPITSTRFAQSGLSRFTSCSGPACAINKMLAREQGKLNATLSKAGKPTIDFNKLQADRLKDLLNATQTGLDKMGMSANQLYASMGGGAGSHGAGAAGLGKKTGAGKVFAKGSGLGAATKGGGAATPKAPNFNFKEEAKPADAVAAPAASIDAYDLKGDINKDSGASIFQVISERYIKSGYPKLLEEIPAATSAPVPLAPEKK